MTSVAPVSLNNIETQWHEGRHKGIEADRQPAMCVYKHTHAQLRQAGRYTSRNVGIQTDRQLMQTGSHVGIKTGS